MSVRIVTHMKNIILGLILIQLSSIQIATAKTPPSTMQVTKSMTSMPLAFTANQGQWDEAVKFRANAGGATMWFAPDGAYYQFTRTIKSEDATPTSIIDKRYGMMPDMLEREPKTLETMMIKAKFIGANTNPIMSGIDMMEYKCNYFIGNEPNEWHTDVPNYTAVMYEDIYNGIDLKYYGNGKQMEYDFIVSPGADYSQIRIEYEGAESIAVNSDGQLVVTTKWGEVIEQRPVVYQLDTSNNRVAINGEYKIKGTSAFGFELDGYDTSQELIIDPILTYSSFLGGTGSDFGYGIAVDANGSSYITGRTDAIDFPTINNFQGYISHSNAFITKVSPDGSSLIYSTYLGGDHFDESNGIVLDDFGNAYIAGETKSNNFPTTQGAFQSNLNESDTLYSDVFVTKLSAFGDSLIYSTYIGGSHYEVANDLAIDSGRNIYITGLTLSADYPVLNAFQNYKGGDAFVTKLNSTGSGLVYSTFLGGSLLETGVGIEVDSDGHAYVVGGTSSNDFPTKRPYQLFQGNQDIFVSKFVPTGTELVYSTFIGSSDSDYAEGIALDNSGHVYIVGWTRSDNYPIKNEFQVYQGLGATPDAIITKFNTTGDGIIYSTYLGGSERDQGYGISVDEMGNAYIIGNTVSIDFPTKGAVQDSLAYDAFNYYQNIFLTKLSFSGNTLGYSTYLGGVRGNYGNGVVVDNFGNAYITGTTSSSDFPIEGNFQNFGGNNNSDAIVAKFSTIPTDVQEIKNGIVPTTSNLSQNYPNPFNPTTTIEFNLPLKSMVTINIYNLLGQQIQQLVDQEYSAGNYRVTWDGTDSNGNKASTGIYFYRIETDNFVESKKMLLLK